MLADGASKIPPASRIAGAIFSAFRAYHAEFNAITRKARGCFEDRDWRATQTDAVARLDLWPHKVEGLAHDLRGRLGERASDPAPWRRAKRAYAALVAGTRNGELAETFYNSVVRRVFSTVGVRPDLEFVSLESAWHGRESDPRTYARYDFASGTARLIERVLRDHSFRVGYRDLAGDSALAAARLDAAMTVAFGPGGAAGVEVLEPVFFRNKGAYLIGRARSRDGRQILPLVLPLLHAPDGVYLDAVLTDEAVVSILFSFTRSHFHVLTDSPLELIDFLKSILPKKPVAELYICLGFDKHGKKELYRDLQQHLDGSTDRFEIADGDRGMVMLVFTLPSYDMVFKVIRDRFDYPKRTSARDVMRRYRLVFERDRVGRLVEAQEFEHLKFHADRFSSELLRELTSEAMGAVKLEDGAVVIEHLYAERKVRPLNVYLRECDDTAARRAVIDYGHAIKELAAANIFPGDFLLKNFGVTRHGRVVFYDYDELCLITDCNFRALPPSRTVEDELAPEPWFAVADDDVFPEEFPRFIGLPDLLRDLFERHHGELFAAEFWRRLQARHAAGEIPDFYPYPQRDRLRRGGL